MLGFEWSLLVKVIYGWGKHVYNLNNVTVDVDPKCILVVQIYYRVFFFLKDTFGLKISFHFWAWGGQHCYILPVFAWSFHLTVWSSIFCFGFFSSFILIFFPDTHVGLPVIICVVWNSRKSKRQLLRLCAARRGDSQYHETFCFLTFYDLKL